MQRNKELDSLRAFAIFFVLASHWTTYGNFGGYSFGAIGVDIFFCMSGFLMTLILIKAREHVVEQGGLKVLGNFYIRRILRIFPVYYCSLFVLLFFATGTGLKEHFSAFLLFASNFYIYDLGHWDGMISHFWSLAVEIQFYLVWPLLLLFLPQRFLRPLFVIGIIIGFCSRAFLYYFGNLETEQIGLLLILPQSCLDLFCFGAITASYYLEGTGIFGKHHKWSALFPILGLALFTIVVSLDLPALVFYRSIIGLSMIFIFSFCLKNPPGFLGRFLRFSFLVYLGQISYGIYIYHNLSEFLVLQYLEPGPFAILVMLFLVLTISTLSWFVLEGPINRMRLKFK